MANLSIYIMNECNIRNLSVFLQYMQQSTYRHDFVPTNGVSASGARRCWPLSFVFQYMQQTTYKHDYNSGGVGIACPCLLQSINWTKLFRVMQL